MGRIGKIFFYEDRNFKGRHYECNNDCPELSSHFSRCNSIRVESGPWVIYERPNYTGNQYVLTKGEYVDYQHWMGYNDTIRSCRIIGHTTGMFRVRIYEHPDFAGQMLELSDDMPILSERWHHNEVHSVNVMDGVWVFYEHPNYRGHQWLLEKGEHSSYSEWGAMHPTVGSIRRIQDV